MASALSAKVQNETIASMIEIVDGVRMKYELKVLQQPERARACGAGAKSSADRRPVDPPPVVELRIYAGENFTEDVTFRHNANFFLFTTLESARPILPGRGAAAATATPQPVLTGMPVAGMAYLDRPSPAGYFIFPDLSVRHEGVYRLSFHLFEEYKGRSLDPEAAPSTAEPVGTKMPQNVQYRLEVKSEPFTVFSAKKFPGLAESTSLSRLVAEQGCRVRIRRDVRMRRREAKPSKDHDDLDDETAAYGRPDRYCTPDNYGHSRARSTSAASADPMPYPHAERRSSLHDVGYYQQQPYQQPAVAPILQPASANFNTHLTFGNPSATSQPAMPVNGGAPAQAAVPYSPNPSSYQTQPAMPPHSRQVSNGSDYGYHPQAYQQPQYAAASYSEPVEYKQAAPFRRPTVPQQGPASARDGSVYPTVDSRLATGNQAYYVQSPISVDPRASTPTGVQALPPLKAVQPAPERKLDGATTPIVGDAGFDTNCGYGAFAGANPVAAATAAAAAGNFARPGKRSYGKVFDTNHISQPVHGGARPEATGQDVPQVECDDGLTDEVDLSLKMLSYRRADGSRQHKKIPSPIC